MYKFTKAILTGILIFLALIAFKLNNQNSTISTPNVNIDNTQQFLQITPNRIGIIDTSVGTGHRDQLLIFDFDPNSKTFKYIESLNTQYILNHPEEFGIPVKIIRILVLS